MQDNAMVLNIAPEGTDFFAETRRNNMRLVHPDDIDLLADVCDKEALLERTAGGQTYTVTYRLLMEDGPTYTRLSAMMADDGRHIIIGVTDVDEQVRRELAVRAAEERHVTYSHIAQTLAKRYAAIYYVDAQTSAYVEFSSSGTFRELGLPSSGADFFAAADEAFSRMVHPDDVAVASDLLDARRLVERLSHAKPTVATFRLMLSVGDVWASMRVMWAEDRRHLIVGLSDVDDQVKAELQAIKRDLSVLVQDLHVKTQCLKLLEKDLEGLRNTGLGNIFALNDRLVSLHSSDHVIRLDRQDLLQGISCAVSFQRPDFHLSESLSAELRFAAQRLLRDQGVRARGTRMDLVVDQVMELEVVHVADRDRIVEQFTCPSVSEPHLAVSVDRNAFPELSVRAVFVQIFHDLRVHRIFIFGLELVPLLVDVVVCQFERIRDIVLAGAVKVGRRDVESKRLRCEREVDLEDLTDIHTGRHAQRIQHDIQRTAVGQIRHIFNGQNA